jgi:hypothetical protein
MIERNKVFLVQKFIKNLVSLLFCQQYFHEPLFLLMSVKIIPLTRVPRRGFPWKNFKGVWLSSSLSSPVPMAYMSTIACTHRVHFNDFHAPYVPRTYMISLSLESARVC